MNEPKEIPIKGAHLYKHGYSGTKAYGRWRGIIQRCTDKNHKNWSQYGGRGIQVCDEWKTFTGFIKDMGFPDAKETLDRIDVNGNYDPSNCRWVTQAEQMRNTRCNKNIEFDGEIKCQKAWAEQIGINYVTLKYRIKTWGLERALTTPKQR